jgi:riboflavin biosynthesis pyrimidine reductase
LNDRTIQGPASEAIRVTLFHAVTLAGDYMDDSGSSRGISNSADLGLLLQARSDNDIAVTGGGTARAEKLNSTARCSICLVSNSLNTLSLPLLKPSEGHKVLLASSNPSLLEAASKQAVVECITLIDGLPLAKQLVESLRSRGFKRILLEGGPQLIQAFSSDELINELHLTVTGSRSKMTIEEAHAFVGGISYLPRSNDSLTLNFDGLNNYLVWLPSGVAA